MDNANSALRRRELRRQKLLMSSEDRLKKIERLKLSSQDADEGPTGDKEQMRQTSEDTQDSSTTPTAEVTPLQQGQAPPSCLSSGCGMAKETGARSSAVSEESACNQSSPSRPVGSVPVSCYSCPDQSPHHTPGVLRSDFQQRAAPAIASSPLMDGTKHLGTGYEASQAQNAPSSESDRNCMTSNRTSASKHSPVQTPDPCAEMQAQRQDRELKLQHLISMKTVVFVILAIITRLWILMYFEQQSIIVVFCITEGLLFYFQIDQAPLQSSAQRVLSAMLTLKGASAESIARIQECLGFVQAAVQDFMTFLFVFVLLHAFSVYRSPVDTSGLPPEDTIPQS